MKYVVRPAETYIDSRRVASCGSALDRHERTPWGWLILDVLTRLGDKLLFDESSLDNCRCMRSINRVAVQMMNHKIDESDIQEYMITGKTYLPERYKDIMDQQIRLFADKIYRYFAECGYNLDIIPVYFVGGGAVVMRNFGKL